jgi:hypothetical protein
MNDLSQVLKAGTLLIIESGEYSNLDWSGPVRLLRDCIKQELADDYRREWVKGEDDWRDKPDPDGFLPWLIKTGRAEAVDDVHCWHVGSYGNFEP